MIAHEKRAHAVLSASGAHRWMHCTPSALIEAGLPDTTSEAAKEGTLAHEIAEQKLRGYFKPDNAFRDAVIKKLKQDALYQPEMDGYTDAYLDYCKAAALEWEKAPYIAIERKLDLSEYILGGFGTADCIMIGDRRLRVIDFKYGKGVPVSAEDNEQLKIYALGVIAAYRQLFDIDFIEMSIFQPRISNISTCTMPIGDLLAFGEVVKQQAALAIKGEGKQTPGDWCRFCRARAQCVARAEKNVEMAFRTRDSIALMTNDEIGGFLERGRDVARWLKDLEDYALRQCLAGKSVPGWKAVEGRGSRMWKDMDQAFSRLEKNGFDEAVLYERKPLSLAQTEKLVGKKQLNDLVGDLIEKKPGKPTLVEESDKREPITNVVKAAEAFKED